jgi:hypothetical protein
LARRGDYFAGAAEEAGGDDESAGFCTLTVVVSFAGGVDPPPQAARNPAATEVHSRKATLRVWVRVMRARIQCVP